MLSRIPTKIVLRSPSQALRQWRHVYDAHILHRAGLSNGASCTKHNTYCD